MSLEIPEKAFAEEVLDPEIHDRLIKDIESVAKRAHIPIQCVWTSMSKKCSPEEVEYVRELRKKSVEGVLGLKYVGKVNPDGPTIAQRMSLIAGACVRNYINAQVLTLNEVFQHLQAGTMPRPTVLLIPNFFMGKLGSKDELPAWRLGLLLDMLYSRQQESLQTFVYIKDEQELKSSYGVSFANHLRWFELVEA